MVKNVLCFNIGNGKNHWQIIIGYALAMVMLGNGNVMMVAAVLYGIYDYAMVVYGVAGYTIFKRTAAEGTCANDKGTCVKVTEHIGDIGEGIVCCKGERIFAKDKATYDKDKKVLDIKETLYVVKRKAISVVERKRAGDEAHKATIGYKIGKRVVGSICKSGRKNIWR
eukprot:378722_1